MKHKTSDILTITLCTSLLLACSACRTCKCPAYSEQLNRNLNQEIRTPQKTISEDGSNLIWNEMNQLSGKQEILSSTPAHANHVIKHEYCPPHLKQHFIFLNVQEKLKKHWSLHSLNICTIAENHNNSISNNNLSDFKPSENSIFQAKLCN